MMARPFSRSGRPRSIARSVTVDGRRVIGGPRSSRSEIGRESRGFAPDRERRWRTQSATGSIYYSTLARSFARARISGGKTLTRKPSARATRRRRPRQLTRPRILTARDATFSSASPATDENCVSISRVQPSCYHKTGQLTESRADPQSSAAHARIKMVSA